MERKRYIENNDDVTSLETYFAALGKLSAGIEELSPADAYGRITAEAIFAKKCDPVYNAAAMDGIAVLAESTKSAREDAPLLLREGEDFVYVNTGNAVGGSFDAVIMIEDVLACDDGIKIITPAYPWQHVRVTGESIVAGELVLPSRHKIQPADIGALIASGNKTIKVYKQPRVGIIPTGKEMIDDSDELSVGKLVESNSKVFAAQTEKYGGVPKRYPIAADDVTELKKAILTAVAENDMVIINAGSSAGTKDYTVGVIAELGEVVVHGIAIKPGKPTILGIIEGKPVIGIPGYPVSAYLVFEAFASKVLLALGGGNAEEKQTVKATLTRRVTSSFKNAEFVRMAAGDVGGKLVATPLERGAAAIMSLVKADGIMKIDRLTEGLEAGAEIELTLMKSLSEIKKSLVIIGSHDMIIDVIADKLPLTSAHVGSMGGISAMLRGECHIAPIHLLDEQTGEYNLSYVRKHFPNRKMVLIKGVGRVQGFLTPSGNPKGVSSVSQLRNGGLSFANRQRGAGTRILFDYKLKQAGISTEEVHGYEKEFGTHLAVAVAVRNGVADTGFAVKSAANAFGLEFIPIGNESYDFLLPYEYLSDERVQAFISVLKSDYFKNKLDELGGYTYDGIGEITVTE